MTADKKPADPLTTGDAEPSTRSGPRARGTVRASLLEAAVALARSGGPDAVVLREVTRLVGVVPNAAYRHFSDREALLVAVRDEALRLLAQRMADRMAQVRAGRHTPEGAQLRLGAVGLAYLEFARTEPGLFDTAFAAPDHPSGGADEPLPFDHLKSALDDLVTVGLLEAERRPAVEHPTWAAVHGLAVLLRGPLRAVSASEQARLESEVLAFIWTGVTQQ